jgi:hypothetical protein
MKEPNRNAEAGISARLTFFRRAAAIMRWEGEFNLFDVLQNGDQIIHRRTVGGIMAGINQTQDAILVHDEVAPQLGGIIAIRIGCFSPIQPGFQVNPACFHISGTPVGALQLISLINCTVMVEQYIKCHARFTHPLLQGWQSSKRDDKYTGVKLLKFFLACAQLCGMFPARYSTQVA